jgi:ATP/maltotriose-dependent transcriptional regulator MalT
MGHAAFASLAGRHDEARELIGRARRLLEEVALTVWLAGPLAQFAAWIELLAGEPAQAERELRSGYDKLHEIGEASWLSTVAAILAESLYAQGRDADAEALTRESEDSAGAEDAYSQSLLRSVRAKALARHGSADEARRLAAASVELVDTTDFLHLRWYARMSLADVLRTGGDLAAAARAGEEALELAELKGSVVGAQLTRELLRSLAAQSTSRQP